MLIVKGSAGYAAFAIQTSARANTWTARCINDGSEMTQPRTAAGLQALMGALSAKVAQFAGNSPTFIPIDELA